MPFEQIVVLCVRDTELTKEVSGVPERVAGSLDLSQLDNARTQNVEGISSRLTK